MHEVCTTHWSVRVLIPASGFCLHNHVCYFIQHSSFTADFLSLRCYQFYPLQCSSHSLSDSLSVSLCSRPPYYAARGGHRHQWGPNGSLGRLERGACKSAVASLSLTFMYLGHPAWPFCTKVCVFVSHSEICWPHFPPSQPSHRKTFILMLHFHYCDTKCSAKH